MSPSPENNQELQGTANLKKRYAADPEKITPQIELCVQEVRAEFDRAGVFFGKYQSLEDAKDAVLLVTEQNDRQLELHLKDTGTLAQTILSDKPFQREFKEIIAYYHPQDPNKAREADLLFDEETIRKFSLAMQIHDIGKIHPEINRVINSSGKISQEERDLIPRHTGTLSILRALGITDEFVTQIVLFHHAPIYWGADPFDQLAIANNQTENFHDMLRTLPLHITLAKFFDISHAMTEWRPYRDRTVLWWESIKQYMSRLHPLFLRYTIQKELDETCPEDPEGLLINLYLDTLKRLWPEITEQLKARRNESINLKRIPKNHPLAA